MRNLSGSSFASVTSLPTASTYSNCILEYLGSLYWSDGDRWIKLSMNMANLHPLCVNAAPKRFTLQTGTTTATTVDLAGPPSGKRWRVVSITYSNSSAGNRAQVLKRKNSGNYYWINTSMGAATRNFNNFWTGPRIPILEYGDTLSYTSATGAVTAVFIAIEEFDAATSFMKSAQLTSFSSGNNTLYTCPAGYFARIISSCASSGVFTLDGAAGVCYQNFSGATRTIYMNSVLSGGSPASPGAGSNSVHVASISIPTGNSTNLTGGAIFSPFPQILEAGDYININTDSNASGQFAYVTVVEYPIY